MTGRAGRSRAAARTRLAGLARLLSTRGLEAGARRDAARDLYELLASLSGLGAAGPSLELAERRPVAGGQAIAPLEAADCVLDSARTAAFLGGLAAALDALSRRFPGERLRALYAGCGPFATLAVPLLAARPDLPVGFTLVDAHPASLASARRLVAALGLEDRVDAWIEGDAGRVRAPGGAPFHLLVIEVMRAALECEPQVAVTRALAPALLPGGVLVPARIAVELAAAGAGRAGRDGPTGGARVRLAALGRTGLDRPAGAVRLPAPGLPRRRALPVVLATRIEVFGGFGLRPGEAGITVDRPAAGLPAVRAGQRIRYRYREGADPGFELRPAGPAR